MKQLKEVINVEEFKEVDGSFKMLLVTSENCGACKMLEPVVAEMSEDHGFAAKKIDGPSHLDLMQELGVMSTPVLVYYKDNEIAGHDVGFMVRNKIAARASEILSR